MQVVLLERVDNLGELGEVVGVKPGYARNFLLPQGKALRATKDNIAYFEAQKKTLEEENTKKKTEAGKKAKNLDGLKVTLIRAASEGGQLYGSVRSQDIAEVVSEAGVEIDRRQVVLAQTYKPLGLFPIRIALHPEVSVEVTVNIARTAEEAKIQLESGAAVIASEEQEQTLEEQAIEVVESEEKSDETEDEAVETASEEVSEEDEKEGAPIH